MDQRGTAGIGTGMRELVAPGVLEDSGRQVRAQALALDTQVLAPLEQTEARHGASWTGLARERYLGLHQGVTQALQQAQVRVDGLGAAMERSAAEYARLTHTRFGSGGLAGGATGAGLPTETEYVAGGSGAGGILRNADQAKIDAEGKLRDYALNPNHPVGGPKAKRFKSMLGYDQSNYQQLADIIRDGVRKYPATPDRVDAFGERFTVYMEITGPNGKTATVLTGWIYDSGSDIPRLVTAYIPDP